jgi:hypothetical protein
MDKDIKRLITRVTETGRIMRGGSAAKMACRQDAVNWLRRRSDERIPL